MVGVAGRSKGCHTCRRRKIRCDQRKPNCERCERTGRQCEGYARGTIFLNQTGFDAVQNRSHHNRNPPEGDARIQIFAATAETYTRPKNGSSIVKNDAGLPSPVSSVGSPLSSGRSNFSLLHSASDRQLDSMCLERICPLRSQQKSFSLYILAPEILSRSKQEPVFVHAFNALKLSMPYGVESPDMILRSRAEYGKALREMQKAIADRKSSISDQTLLAVTLLKQYELQEVSSRTADAFDAHVNGHMQLIKLRGASNLKDTFGRSMVREVRYLDVLASLSNHKRGQLISAEWRCPAVWADAHHIRLSLIDVAADAGAVYEDFESLGTACGSVDRMELLNRISKVQQDLYIWHQRVTTVATLRPPWPDCEEAPSNQQVPSVHDEAADSKIEVNSLEQKYMMLDFWAVSIITNQLNDHIRSTWPQEALSCIWPQMRLPERSLEARQIQLAANILKVSAPCVADKCGMWGMLRSTWGLRNAYTALKRFSSPTAKELVVKLERVLTRVAARDFRKAPLMAQAPSKGAIESTYDGGSRTIQESLWSNVELPEVLARSTI